MAPISEDILRSLNDATSIIAGTISQLSELTSEEHAAVPEPQTPICSCQKLSTGAIVGISFAAVFGFLILCLFLTGCCSESDRGRSPQQSQSQAGGNNSPGVKAASGSAAAQEATKSPAVDGTSSPTSAASTTSDEKMEHATTNNAIGMSPRMDELFERQRKLQERRERLLELERLDIEEENLREQMRRAGPGDNGEKKQVP